MRLYRYIAMMGGYGTFQSEIYIDDGFFIFIGLATIYIDFLKSTISLVYRYVISWVV